ncbi:late competence development ComFB family protein [Neosynechococcus sphagnicola]|nr:late competence development ComFB family protein [Neosynechococcus sphagnicola]
MQLEQSQNYRNAMESLVAVEVEMQLRRLPPKLKEYICLTEVIAYALNRLPPLYATCEKGWKQQQVRGRQEYGNQVTAAVRQALAAIQRDPLRVSTPLRHQKDSSAEFALQELKNILGQDQLTWDEIPDAIEQALIKTARGEIEWQRRPNPDEPFVEWKYEDQFLK